MFNNDINTETLSSTVNASRIACFSTTLNEHICGIESSTCSLEIFAISFKSTFTLFSKYFLSGSSFDLKDHNHLKIF